MLDHRDLDLRDLGDINLGDFWDLNLGQGKFVWNMYRVGVDNRMNWLVNNWVNYGMDWLENKWVDNGMNGLMDNGVNNRVDWFVDNFVYDDGLVYYRVDGVHMGVDGYKLLVCG